MADIPTPSRFIDGAGSRCQRGSEKEAPARNAAPDRPGMVAKTPVDRLGADSPAGAGADVKVNKSPDLPGVEAVGTPDLPGADVDVTPDLPGADVVGTPDLPGAEIGAEFPAKSSWETLGLSPPDRGTLLRGPADESPPSA